MNYQFPRQLFPTFYNLGPPTAVRKQCCGKWGSYDRVLPLVPFVLIPLLSLEELLGVVEGEMEHLFKTRRKKIATFHPFSGTIFFVVSSPLTETWFRFQGGSSPPSSWTFTSRHRVRGETWRPTESVPVPLLSPKYSVQWSSEPPDPMSFTKHMENFFEDHCQDAFGCLVEALGEDFNVEAAATANSSKRQQRKKVSDELQLNKCPPTYPAEMLRLHAAHLSDVVHSIPPKLLASLLYEELEEQRDSALFFEGATGGALAFVPFGNSGSQSGCLLYPGNKGLDCLNFHKVELQHQKGLFSRVDTSSCEPFSVQLKAPIRQISTTSLFNESCVAVRSDYRCGVWRFGEEVEPRLLQVVDTMERATCVSSSPHLLGEVLVVTESGAAKLWNVGKGIQTVRQEDHNLYFNANSRWRWCHFSAHPRVMVYADRTGVELTDMRVNPANCNSLFRVGNTSECCRGERVILSQYLGEVHSFHHLVTTQFSAYVMDERFPTVPMLKWDHMMLSPPMFCHVISNCSTSPGSSASENIKLLLGSHSSQEVTMLQYSGGTAAACYSLGPPLALHRPRHSLRHLPVQIPHRFQVVKDRLSFPAAGLTCIQQDGEGDQKCVCVLQLTHAGDIFYQVLELQPPEDSVLLKERNRSPSGRAEPLASDTSSNEDMVGPTQEPNARRLVPETPERECQLPSDPELDPDPESNSELDADRAPVTKKERRVSGEVLTVWRRWLQKLCRKSRSSARVPALRRVLVNVGPVAARHRKYKNLVRRFGQELSEIMAKRSMLVATDQDQSQSQVLLDALDADAWSDPLSRRLTATWQGGEAAWQAWWREELGLDRQEKTEALLQRRRQQKAARRASGRHRELPASFTSSANELSDWSSQGALSGGERGTATLLPGSGEPAATLPLTPSSQRNVDRLVKDYLGSLCTPQDDIAQQDGSCSVLDQEEAASAPLSQHTFGLQSVSQAGPRVDLSQDAQVFSRFSQSQSQSSQGRTRVSQASQPTKKKSRMGF